MKTVNIWLLALLASAGCQSQQPALIPQAAPLPVSAATAIPEPETVLTTAQESAATITATLRWEMPPGIIPTDYQVRVWGDAIQITNSVMVLDNQTEIQFPDSNCQIAVRYFAGEWSPWSEPCWWPLPSITVSWQTAGAMLESSTNIVDWRQEGNESTFLRFPLQNAPVRFFRLNGAPDWLQIR